MNTTRKLLLSLIMLLFAALVYVGSEQLRTYESNITPNRNISLHGRIVDSLFRSCISRYQLGDSILRKIKSPFKKQDSLFACYKLTLPADIPIPLLITHLKSDFPLQSIEINGTEREINGKGWIEIYSGNELKLYAEVIPDKKNERKNGSVFLSISGIEDAPPEEKEKLLSSSEVFAVILKTPFNSDLIRELMEHDKFIIPEAATDKADIDYLFSINYSQNRLRESIRSYQSAFPAISHILFRPNTEIFQSPSYAALKSLLFSQGIAAVPGNEFFTIGDIPKENVEKKILEWLKVGSEKLFLPLELPLNRFEETQPVRENLRRRGVRFLALDKVIFN